MTYTLKLVDQIKVRIGKDSDYAVCKALGVTSNYMTQWRKRGSQFSNSTALKAAKILGLPPLLVIARINMETCSEQDKKDWESVEELALMEMDLYKAPTSQGLEKLKKRFGDFLILCSIRRYLYKSHLTCDKWIFCV